MDFCQIKDIIDLKNSQITEGISDDSGRQGPMHRIIRSYCKSKKENLLRNGQKNTNRYFTEEKTEMA